MAQMHSNFKHPQTATLENNDTEPLSIENRTVIMVGGGP